MSEDRVVPFGWEVDKSLKVSQRPLGSGFDAQVHPPPPLELVEDHGGDLPRQSEHVHVLQGYDQGTPPSI